MSQFFSQVPAFIVNMLLIINLSFLIVHRPEIHGYREKKTKKKQHNHACKLVNIWDFIDFYLVVKSKASLQFDVCTKILALI